MMDKYNKVCDEYESQDEDAETEKLLDEMDHDIATIEIKIANKIKNPTPAPAPEKKESGIGWLIFGSVVLAITLGAVNVLKKK